MTSTRHRKKQILSVRPKRDSHLTSAERQSRLGRDALRLPAQGDTEAEWKSLARAILEQALADAEYHAHVCVKIAKLRRWHERHTHIRKALEPCRAELMSFLAGDWCAFLCDTAGLSYERYVSGALNLLGGAA